LLNETTNDLTPSGHLCDIFAPLKMAVHLPGAYLAVALEGARAQINIPFETDRTTVAASGVRLPHS